MTVIRSLHDAPLPLPGGTVLRPGARTRVNNWHVVKEHHVVAAWLRAGAIEVVEGKDQMAEAVSRLWDVAEEAYKAYDPDEADVSRVTAIREAVHPLDHDNDGHPGGSLPVEERGLDDLRAQYARLHDGQMPDGRWGAARIQEAIDAALA